MSTFDSNKIPLREVITGIKKGEYQLPDFQRGWVWDDEHVRSLLVSIARSFPIGAVMTLETGGDVRFQVRPIENVKLNGPVKPEKLILDGQQRLTSLTQVLGLKQAVQTFNHKKQKVERYYYIDIKKILEGNDLDEAFYSVGKDKTTTSNFGRDIELDLSTIEKEVELLQFPCSHILDYDDWQDHCYEAGKFKEFKAFKKAVLEPFRDYNIPVIALNKHTSKEAVCIVFEKVNTGGVSLTVFELITASFAAEGYNLRNDWYGDRADDQNGRLGRLKNESLLKVIQPTDFIQALTLLNSYDLHLQAEKTDSQVPGISCKRKTMLNLKLADYLDWAEQLESAFIRTAQFLKKECFYHTQDLPYRTQLVPLAAIMTHLKDRWLEPKINEKLSQWFWCGVLGELYGGAIENRFAHDLEDFLDWINDDNKLPRTVFDASFHPSRLETLRTRNSAAYKGIYVLMTRYGAKDFYWNGTIQELDKMGHSLEIHHLFPKKWCKQHEINSKVYDSIINKTAISKKANRKIGGDAPSRYLKKLQEDPHVSLNDREMDVILDTHLIDPGSFRSDDFTRFIHLRSQKLIKLIYGAMGKLHSLPNQIMLFGYGSEQQKLDYVTNRLVKGETNIVEFKSTLRWNIRSQMRDKKMEEVILKTIAAFNNSNGGTLFIGVDDDGNALGLDADYKTFKNENKDHFEIHLRNLINSKLGTDFATSQVEIDFPVIKGQEICQIHIERGKEPKYLLVDINHGSKQEKFYVRSGNTSQELNIDEAAKYISQRFFN